MLCIIAKNKQHYEHILYMYAIPREQARYIFSPDQLRGLSGFDTVIMKAPEWWEGKSSELVDEIEMLVDLHNSRRKQCLK